MEERKAEAESADVSLGAGGSGNVDDAERHNMVRRGGRRPAVKRLGGKSFVSGPGGKSSSSRREKSREYSDSRRAQHREKYPTDDSSSRGFVGKSRNRDDISRIAAENARPDSGGYREVSRQTDSRRKSRGFHGKGKGEFRASANRRGARRESLSKPRSPHQNPAAAPVDRPRIDRPNLPLDSDIDLHELPVGVRAELRGLRPDAAEEVGNYLVMAGRLVAQDPEAALPYAQAVKNRASRLPVAREALAEVAYAAQRFDIALTEFRALRRMTGNPEYLPVLADCERAVGRITAAMQLIKSGLAEVDNATIRIELHLVESGIRYDQGQVKEALRVLKEAIAETGKRGSKIARARLRYAYADLLLELGHRELAEKWFSTAAGLDEFGETDAEIRLAELSGIEILTADLVVDEEE